MPVRDPWLDRWLPAVREAAGGGPVLELGCDSGLDTAWLLAQGLRVVATDLSPASLQRCAQAAPQAQLLAHDLRTPLPFAPGSFGVVIASLCLHYFDWATTERAVAGIHEVLAPGGLFLARLNSTRDVHHGAEGFEEIEPHFYRVGGYYAECKRFFDAHDVARLCPPPAWQVLSCEELTFRRYAEPKTAWEVVLRRAGPPVARA